MDKDFFSQVDILARTLYGEARGEGLIGIEAVANVIMNRVALSKQYTLWWGKSIEEVCLKPFQFSCWTPSDNNFYKLIRVSSDDDVFRMCLRVAQRAVSGTLSDITKGATHYHRKDVSPAWARRLIPVFEYKNHLFYREIP